MAFDGWARIEADKLPWRQLSIPREAQLLEIFCLYPSAFFSAECQKPWPKLCLSRQEEEADFITTVSKGQSSMCTWPVRLSDSNGELVASSLLTHLNFLFLSTLVSFWVRLLPCDRKMATNTCNLYAYSDSLKKPLFLSTHLSVGRLAVWVTHGPIPEPISTVWDVNYRNWTAQVIAWICYSGVAMIHSPSKKHSEGGEICFGPRFQSCSMLWREDAAATVCKRGCSHRNSSGHSDPGRRQG